MSAQDESQAGQEKRELFHHGVITKLFTSNNMGLVRTENGREVQFSFDLVILLGDVKKPSDLREGEEVGYDVGWTSKGLRITKIKVYSEASAREEEHGPSLKGQESQSQDLPTQDLPHKDSE